jgi:hypothetical protein
MDLRPHRFLLALFLSFGFLASASFNATALETRYIGQVCEDKYDSQAGTSIQGGSDLIYLICFESTDNPPKWVWSKDENETPAINWILDPIAYGRTPEVCGPDAKNSAFVTEFGRTYCKDGVWKNDTYEKAITKTAWVPPFDNTVPILKINSAKPSAPTEDEPLERSTTLLVLAAFAMMMTPTTVSRSAPPEYIEIRARRDEKLKIESSKRKFLSFLTSPAITLSKYKFFEGYLRNKIERISRISPAIATIIRDGDYLRAVLGSLTFFIYPLAILTGVYSFVERQSKPESLPTESLLPLVLPSLIGMALMIGIGVLDSFAGALAGATFFVLAVIVDVHQFGFTADTKRFFSTLVSIFLIACTPSLFAGALRKFDGLHKNPGRNWNYAIDYFLSPLVTSWMVWKVLGVISDLSGSKFEDPRAAVKIAVFIWFMLIIRYFTEHYVARNWGDRLNELISNDVVQSNLSIILRTLLKSAWVWILITSIGKFQEDPSGVPVLIALFAVPSITKLMWKNPPEHLGLLNLRGAPKFALLFLVGIGLTTVLEDPKFVDDKTLIMELALLPLLFFSVIEALTENHTHTPRFFVENKWGIRIYQATGIAIFIFIAGYIFVTVNQLS